MPQGRKYIDLPLQHAADDVLKRMKRPGTGQVHEKLLARIRERVPGVSLRTTFIVGFPGETEAEFEELRRSCARRIRPRRRVHLLSRRRHHRPRPLQRRAGQRQDEAQEQVDGRTEAHRGQKPRARIGTYVRVMVDGPSPEHDLVWRGRVGGQAPDIDPVVYFTDADPEAFRPGLLRAGIVGSRDYDLVVRPVAAREPVVAPNSV